jgi:ubiquinone/menaquinone biosynthesis C-methylase UbiE
MMIDRELNYGRDVIQHQLRRARPYSSVLDIGAGGGSDLLTARIVEPQSKLYAIECNSTNVDRLSSNGIYTYSLNIEQEVIPLAPESIDVIISNQTFEHLKEVFWVLHEASRVLKVGGHFIVGVPNLASLHNRILLAAGQQPTSLKNNSAHVRGYTRSDLINLLGCFPQGYQLQSWEGSNFYPLPRALARPASRLLPSMAWAIFMLFRKSRAYSTEFLDYVVSAQLETNFFLGPLEPSSHQLPPQSMIEIGTP